MKKYCSCLPGHVITTVVIHELGNLIYCILCFKKDKRISFYVLNTLIKINAILIILVYGNLEKVDNLKKLQICFTCKT